MDSADSKSEAAPKKIAGIRASAASTVGSDDKHAVDKGRFARKNDDAIRRARAMGRTMVL